MDSQVLSKPSWRRWFADFSDLDHEGDASGRIRNKLRRRVLHQHPVLASDLPSNEDSRPLSGIPNEQAIEVVTEPTAEEAGDGPPPSSIAICGDNLDGGILTFPIKD